jgi:hypothetical protein
MLPPAAGIVGVIARPAAGVCPTARRTPSAQREAAAVDDARVMLHLFLAVLIVGTLWRLTSYHLIASPQPQLNHLGLAMAQQY